MESFLVGAISSLIITGLYFLFKKPSKKKHLYIQNTILIILAVLCLIMGISSIFALEDFPALIFLSIFSVSIAGFFIGWKLNKNLKLLQSDELKD